DVCQTARALHRDHAKSQPLHIVDLRAWFEGNRRLAQGGDPKARLGADDEVDRMDAAEGARSGTSPRLGLLGSMTRVEPGSDEYASRRARGGPDDGVYGLARGDRSAQGLGRAQRAVGDRR